MEVEARALLVVADHVRIGHQHVPTRTQGVHKPTGDGRDGRAIAQVVQDFGANDQVVVFVRQPVCDVALEKTDVAQPCTCLPGAFERLRREVERLQRADAACQALGEAALGAAEFRRLPDRAVGQELERLIVFPLLVGARIVPGIPPGEDALPVILRQRYGRRLFVRRLRRRRRIRRPGRAVVEQLARLAVEPGGLLFRQLRLCQEAIDALAKERGVALRPALRMGRVERLHERAMGQVVVERTGVPRLRTRTSCDTFDRDRRCRSSARRAAPSAAPLRGRPDPPRATAADTRSRWRG
jgi:hypothetical protein